MSNKDGAFSLPSVPLGRYMLSTWHERATGANAREIMVGPGPLDLGVLRLTETAAAIPNHANKYGHDYLPPPAPGTGYIIIK